MRTSLLPSLLENVTHNLSYRTLDLAVFEMRPVFMPQQGEELPYEPTYLSGAMYGRREPFGWNQSGDAYDFYDLKGVVESLLETALVENIAWQADAGEPYLHPGKSCSVFCGEKKLGVLGEVHPGVLDNYDIDEPVFVFELNVEALLESASDKIKFEPISRYPDVYRDSAFLLDDAITAEQIMATIEKSQGKLVEKVVLFDVYRGKGVPEGKKSVAIRVQYRSSERTLTDDEINKAHGRIVKVMEKQLEAQLR